MLIVLAQSWHHLFKTLAIANSESELRSRLMDNISQYFGVQRWGLYLLDKNHHLASFDVVGVSDRFVERYDAIGKEVDPVLQYVMDFHAPAHEELIWSPGQWKQSKLYQRCCREYQHEHIMTGPIVGNGNLIGTIHFARTERTKAFNQDDLTRLGAVCLHLSACLAQLRSLSSRQELCKISLTPRERQIANLVARGLTNAEVGNQLWISKNTVKQALKRMFIKLEVHSRTEMVIKLKDLLDYD